VDSPSTVYSSPRLTPVNSPLHFSVWYTVHSSLHFIQVYYDLRFTLVYCHFGPLYSQVHDPIYGSLQFTVHSCPIQSTFHCMKCTRTVDWSTQQFGSRVRSSPLGSPPQVDHELHPSSWSTWVNGPHSIVHFCPWSPFVYDSLRHTAHYSLRSTPVHVSFQYTVHFQSCSPSQPLSTVPEKWLHWTAENWRRNDTLNQTISFNLKFCIFQTIIWKKERFFFKLNIAWWIHNGCFARSLKLTNLVYMTVW